MRIVEFNVINANQKIDKSIVCWLGKATLGQMRPFILMFGLIHNSVIACDIFKLISFENFPLTLSISIFNGMDRKASTVSLRT